MKARPGGGAVSGSGSRGVGRSGLSMGVGGGVLTGGAGGGSAGWMSARKTTASLCGARSRKVWFEAWMISPTAARCSATDKPTAQRRCLCGGAGGLSERVKTHLDRARRVSEAGRSLAIAIVVGERFHHGFEQRRLDHVEGGAVVVEHGHRAVVRLAQHGGRVLLELGHAHGKTGVDRFHFWLQIRR